MSVNVVQFPIESPLTDIPMRLRQMADQMESGGFGDMGKKSILIILSDPEASLRLCMLGQFLFKDQIVGQLQMAVIKTATDDWDNE